MEILVSESKIAFDTVVTSFRELPDGLQKCPPHLQSVWNSQKVRVVRQPTQKADFRVDFIMATFLSAVLSSKKMIAI